MAVNNTDILVFVFVIAYGIYVLSSLLTVVVALILSERRREEWPLLSSICLFPWYKGFFRWVRIYSLLLEIGRFNYEDSYLPESAWRNAKRW
jgi:hypothetical protein